MQSDSSSSDTPFLRRRTVKNTIYSSDEDIIGRSRKWKNRPRQISSSSEDSPVAGPSRQKIQQNSPPVKRTKLTNLKTSSDSDDSSKNKMEETERNGFSSDDDRDMCPICHTRLEDIYSRPQSCKHMFHTECIRQWTLKSNTCPLDRFPFKKIIEIERKNETELREFLVVTPPAMSHSDDDEINIVSSEEEPDSFINDVSEDSIERYLTNGLICRICKNEDREEDMVLCEGCDICYHRDCLEPPLYSTINDKNWYCPSCELHTTGHLETNTYQYENTKETQQSYSETRVR